MMKRISTAFLPLALIPLFLSCAARINGSLQGDGQADLFITASLEPAITRLIRALSAATGAPQQGPILDGPAIAASMSEAPGVSSVSLKNSPPETVEGPVKISRVGDFLKHGNTAGFIGFEQGAAGRGRCTIKIDRNSGPELLALISPDVRAYLEALMAPIATGEVLTKTEYLELITSFYGKVIADEISKALIRASIDFPGPVQSVQGGTFNGRKAEFTVPLLDIFVLEKPLSYEVVWR